MKALHQRVTQARVTVDDNTVASIGRGVLLLLGIEQSDTPQQAKDLCRRTINYRIFPDQQGRMNLSLNDLVHSSWQAVSKIGTHLDVKT